MAALLITSLASGSGKTTICAGLAKHFLDRNQKVGFFKPVVGQNQKEADSDVSFMKKLLKLEEPVEVLSPVFADESKLKLGIKDAYTRIASGKDIVIIEGAASQQVSRFISEQLSAKVILIQPYSQGMTVNKPELGALLLGVVANRVPRARIDQVRKEIEASNKTGVKILGILPEERALLALTVAELADRIHGKLVQGSEQSGELVENVMLGALCVDPGPNYYSHKENQVIVLRKERPDMQLAALQAPARCLVITGETSPKPAVLVEAEEKSVPIILAKDESVSDISATIEDAIGTTRFNQESKLPKLMQVLDSGFDFAAVEAGLGLKS